MNTLYSSLTLSCLVAFAVAVFCVVLLKPIAAKLGLQDLPGGRKHHKLPTPVIGGICMFIGFCFGLLTLGHSLQEYRGFIGASALLMFVGVLDDMHELSAHSRFITQVFAALLMIFWSNNIIHSFGNLVFLGNINLSILAIPITVFATVGAINAVNMLDGVDGLLGSTAIIQFIFLAYIAWESANFVSYSMISLIIAVLLGYLVFNFPLKMNTPKIFMGDAGSMFVGFCLTWFFINLTQHQGDYAKPVTMLWIFAIPLFDTTWLLLKRTHQRINPFKPNRDHLHHLLKLRGLSDLKVIAIINSGTLLFGLLGIFALQSHINQSIQFLVFILLFLIYCFVINYSWQQISNRTAAEI